MHQNLTGELYAQLSNPPSRALAWSHLELTRFMIRLLCHEINGFSIQVDELGCVAADELLVRLNPLSVLANLERACSSRSRRIGCN